MSGPDLIYVETKCRPLCQLKVSVGPALVVELFNRTHTIGDLVEWRGERTDGQGFLKGKAYLERGILPVVQMCGHLTPIPLSWILPHEDESESESDG